jgi:transposase
MTGGSFVKLQDNACSAMRRGRKIAKVAMARKLAVGMYWMWRKGWDYEQLKKFGSHAGQPGHRDGVQ